MEAAGLLPMHVTPTRSPRVCNASAKRTASGDAVSDGQSKAHVKSRKTAAKSVRRCADNLAARLPAAELRRARKRGDSGAQGTPRIAAVSDGLAASV
jgi:hypothetical protein